jgi:hypothetical protein
MEDATLAAEMRDMAEDFARIAGEQGYALDFTPASIATVERIIEELFTPNKRFGRGKADKPAAEFANVAPAVGAYVGEVIARNHAGHWETHPDFGPGVVIGDENMMFPVGKAVGRFENGREDNLDVFYKVGTGELA